MELKHQIDSDLEKVFDKLYEYLLCSKHTTSYRYTYEAEARKTFNEYFFGKKPNIKNIIFNLFENIKVGENIDIKQEFPDVVYKINKSSFTSYLTFLCRCGFITKVSKTTIYKLNGKIPPDLKLTDIKDEKKLKLIQRSNKIQSLDLV
jgi:hypothetical protein